MPSPRRPTNSSGSSSSSSSLPPYAADLIHAPSRAAFDPWNSSSTGHQRAETRGPPGWHESRSVKLHSQFQSGATGGKRISDRVRARALNSVADMLRNPGSMRRPCRPSPPPPLRLCEPPPEMMTELGTAGESSGPRGGLGQPPVSLPLGRDQALSSCCPPGTGDDDDVMAKGEEEEEEEEGTSTAAAGKAEETQRNIFDGLVVCVNGSTHPLISDHRLKHLLAEHGARTSIHLGRRQVTHVILGRPSGPAGGAGGGLAGGKLEREIRRVGGCGVKYVGVEWILESIKAGKRLPEARFANLKVAARGQQSVLGAFSKAKNNTGGSTLQATAAATAATR
ncbi:hypothetical protein B0T19DRAFT_400210 [Cercophora scortea]|uniref:BRCT domain-containing protein n=1 Tax=Cercophora scortea TaxID=314031 RepID=A0AAE0MCE5_9PEZI|nr:hypothetical protein B0T19DRAFT_400210 [Cercophora scortea]